MSDNVTQFPLPPEPPEFMVGPFETYKVQIEGRIIPQLTAFRDRDEIALVVDGRFSVSVPKAIAHSVAWLLANALAVGAGYPHLGAESKDRPFAPRGMQLPSLPFPEAT